MLSLRLALCALLPAFAAAQTVLLDFDATTEPCVFAQTVATTNQYAAQGVTFMGPGGSDGGAVLNECGSFGVSGHSSPNFLAFNTSSGLMSGGIPRGPETILFSPAVSDVSVMAGHGSSGTITFECFSGMTSVGSDTRGPSSTLGQLMVTGTGIDSCTFTFTGSVCVLDDLTFDAGPPPPPPPTCTLTLPMSPGMDDIDVIVDAMSMTSSVVDLALDVSTDGGTTFVPATMSAASPNPNPALGVATGVSVFTWDSRGDMVGIAALEPGVIVRATVTDSVSMLSATCSAMIDVDNTMLCNGICGDCDQNAAGPDILDALTAAQIAAGLLQPTPLQVACCDVNASTAVDILDALSIAQSAAGLTVTLTCL